MTEPQAQGGRRISGRTIGAIVAIVLVLLFIVLNTDQVEVNLLLVDFEIGVWFLIIISALLGLVAGFLLGRPSRKS